MLRKFNCLGCGATDTSMVHADDPWCGDKCHVKIATELNISQRALSATVFYFITDWYFALYTNCDWNRLKETVRDYRRHREGHGTSIQDLFRNGAEPSDWSRRALLYSQNPWGIEVRELRKPRTEAQDGILSAR